MVNVVVEIIVDVVMAVVEVSAFIGKHISATRYITTHKLKSISEKFQLYI